MTERTTDELIGALRRGLAPVRPLPRPVFRAALWLGLVTAIISAALLRWANPAIIASRTAEPRLALECAAALLTGITAVVAAFYLSLPDHTRLWRYAPLPPLLLWIATSGLGCLQYGAGLGPAGDRLGESRHCFMFIVLISAPLSVLLYGVLRRARPLEPLPVALCAALGVAALAAFVLQFFHPFDTTVVDLSAHLAAVAVVVALAGLSRRALA